MNPLAAIDAMPDDVFIAFVIFLAAIMFLAAYLMKGD